MSAPSPPKRVLVLGKDSRSLLAVVRSLGRRGIRVHVAGHARDGLVLHSRYLARAHELPEVTDDDGPWLSALKALLEAERFDLVLPTNDSSTLALHRRRDELARYAKIYLPPAEALEIAFDKLRTWELARSLGIPVPRQIHLKRAESSTPDLARELGLPVVLKPRASFAFGRTKWESQVRKAYDAGALRAYVAALSCKGEVLAQQNFIGRGVGVEVLADKGEILLAFQHERVHEPPLGGGSSYRKSVPLDPELLEATRKLLRALDYSGVAMVEFKVNHDTRTWVLIEVNARFWGSLPLALASGADFPHALCELWMEGVSAPAEAYRAGIHGRNLAMDFGWMLGNLKADHADPTLCTVPWARVAAEIWNVARLRERSDAWVLDDHKPGLVEIARTARETGRILWSKLHELPLRFPPWRSWRARQLRHELAAARRVLFVCKGNICRSPFAESCARGVLPPQVEISSAGYYRDAGRASPHEAIEAAREHGVDLSRHRSAVVDEEVIRRADIVFVFDEETRGALFERYPEASGKTHSLGLLRARGPVQIKDPYAGQFADFRAVFGQIAGTLALHDVRDGQDSSTRLSSDRART